MRNKKTILAVSLLFMLQNAQAEFFVGPGGTGYGFMKVPLASRAAAMGGAVTSLSGDPLALEFNPAGLKNTRRKNFQLSYLDYLEDTSLQSISFTTPLHIKSNRDAQPKMYLQDNVFLGFMYKGFSADDKERATDGREIGNFSISERLLQVSLSYSPLDTVAVGFAGKVIDRRIQNNKNNAFAGDAGLLWTPTDQVSFGASILNVGPDKKFISEKEKLPTTGRAGASIKVNSILLSADLISGRDKVTSGAAGLEFSPTKFFQLRGGVLHNTTLEFSGGVGINFNPQNDYNEDKQQYHRLEESTKKHFERTRKKPVLFGFDYAFQTRNEFGLTHTATFRIAR